MIDYEKVKFTGLSPELRGPRIGLSAVETELQCGLAEMDAVSPESAERRGSGLLLPADEIIRFTEVKATVISNPGIRKEQILYFLHNFVLRMFTPANPESAWCPVAQWLKWRSLDDTAPRDRKVRSSA